MGATLVANWVIVQADVYLPSVSRLASRSPSAIMSTKDVVPSPKALRDREVRRWARVSKELESGRGFITQRWHFRGSTGLKSRVRCCGHPSNSDARLHPLGNQVLRESDCLATTV